MLIFIASLYLQDPKSKIWSNSLSGRFIISNQLVMLITFLSKWKRKLLNAGHFRIKWEVVSSSRSHLQVALTQLKLCLKRCSRRSLKSHLSLVKSLKPLISKDVNDNLGSGRYMWKIFALNSRKLLEFLTHKRFLKS